MTEYIKACKCETDELNVFACVISGQSGDILKKVKEHTKQINDIQTSVDLTMFITASKDNSAKVRTVYSALLVPWHSQNLTAYQYKTLVIIWGVFAL